MTQEEIQTKLTAMIADKFEIDASTIAPETSFTNDLDADSIDLVELVLEMEEEFGSEIPDEDAEKLITVKDATEYISSHQK
ncbi:acyl carrier protein [Companilactobacillus metriopterae]|uniref:acyl carrier protein n=1 Tax=Companilactobacillus metriopterae TaxID=1909267 RepID=UPI00100BD172|nr:acyl carrier protein [Companilactobacillus metriopterae]